MLSYFRTGLYLEITISSPVTDEDVNDLITRNYGDLIGNTIFIDKNNVGIVLNFVDFVQKYLSPEQHTRLIKHLEEKILRMLDQFYGSMNTKGARN